jgi:hypothetical protein
MTINGHIQNGVAVPDTPVGLPDGTPVHINTLPAEGTFWENKTLERIVQEQGVRPIESVDELAGDWPPEDSIDEFLEFLREIRKR